VQNQVSTHYGFGVSVPPRLLVTGNSGSGKTTLATGRVSLSPWISHAARAVPDHRREA